MKTKKEFSPDIRLEMSFTVDLMHVESHEQDQEDGTMRYRLALSATGTTRVLPDMRIGYSHALVGGIVADYEEHGGGFALLPETLKYPPGVSSKEATSILKKIFEDSGRGAAVDEDWVWLPVRIDDFLSKIFKCGCSQRLATVLHAEVNRVNAQGESKKSTKDKNASC